ncbi:unnamed protein product [Camellia sinensis]
MRINISEQIFRRLEISTVVDDLMVRIRKQPRRRFGFGKRRLVHWYVGEKYGGRKEREN